MFLSSLLKVQSRVRCFNESLSKVRHLSNFVVLGIETSFDDTGCAIVTSEGEILGEALKSQQEFHLAMGGCNPPIARDLHEETMESVINEAFSSAKLSLKDINAVATTVKPGLILSLGVGLEQGKRLSKEGNKPFIPIHHMEAHALTVRMVQKDVEFPFLVSLISGCHSLIAIAHAVDKYSLLGSAAASAPGELLDKVARRMKLRNLPECKNMSGGRAIEKMAENGDPFKFEFKLPAPTAMDCDFNFAGLRMTFNKYLSAKEIEHDLPPDGVIPEIADLCASFQSALCKHLCQRLQRAMIFIEMKNLLPNNKILVCSGGVACNQHVQKTYGKLCDAMGYRLYVPPPKLCTDNGVMIAWNGVERFRINSGVYDPSQIDSIIVEPKVPFGEDWRPAVAEARIICNTKNRIRVEK